MSLTSIEVRGLGKQYRLIRTEGQPDTWRRAVGAWAKAPFAYLLKMLRPPTEDEILWALREVSFEIRQGEVVGILGRNGAGKSTLLKILSRITDPTVGRAVVRGRVGSLLEVGTGFHPELTGRENVYMSGVILGMKKPEVDRKFDEIVNFAALDRFIDTPVKRYSSGMHVRLAFAVAAHLEPEIMIMDEVLSVGDVSFRKKSEEKMRSAALDGRTVLFVSHSMETMASLCTRALWLEQGQLVADGPVGEVVENYLAMAAPTMTGLGGSNGLTVQSVAVRNRAGQAVHHIHPADDLTVEIQYSAARPIDRPYLWISIDSERGPCFAANMLLDGHNHACLEGEGTLACTFRAVPLLPQSYSIRMAIRPANGGKALFGPQEVAEFSVIGDLKSHGLTSAVAQAFAPASVPVVLPYEWRLPDGEVIPVALQSEPGR